MRIKIAAYALVAGFFVFIAYRQAALERRVAVLIDESQKSKEEREAQFAQIGTLTTELEEVKTQAAVESMRASATGTGPLGSDLSAMNKQLQQLQPAAVNGNAVDPSRPQPNRASSSSMSQVPEYDPTDPMQPPPAPVAETVATNAPSRGWGFEQAAGPPDTFQAGDIPTAWASLDPDGGAEWLGLHYAEPRVVGRTMP